MFSLSERPSELHLDSSSWRFSALSEESSWSGVSRSECSLVFSSFSSSEKAPSELTVTGKEARTVGERVSSYDSWRSSSEDDEESAVCTESHKIRVTNVEIIFEIQLVLK